MPKQYRQEDEVTSQDMNVLFGDSLPGYATEAERSADWEAPISDLALPSQQADIPLGQQSVVGGANPFYGAWNGAAWRPWNRHTPAETGLVQVAVGDITVEESVSGTVTARFPVRLVNARADINTWTDPTFHITAGDLGTRVIRCSARAVEYDPRPYGERTRDISYTEAVAGSDFLPSVVDLTFLPSDQQLSAVRGSRYLFQPGRPWCAPGRAATGGTLPVGTLQLPGSETFETHRYLLHHLPAVAATSVGRCNHRHRPAILH